ncbi:MAG: hypothetical protein K6A41_08180 [Bacteroidales bacterium]|nr:hypothetical protein [Bacteroidales bacterium]
MNYLSKITGFFTLLMFIALGAMGGTQKSPYSQLMEIMEEYEIPKKAVTDELTENELVLIHEDVTTVFNVPGIVIMDSKSIGDLLTNILKYQYSNRKGKEWEWRKIQYSSRPEDYEMYLRAYPKSKHYIEAYAKYLVTGLYWNFGMSEGSIETTCIEYIDLYEECKFWYNMVVRKYWCDECDIPNIDYEGFSSINPRQWVDVSEEYLASLAEERQAWKAALREGTHDAYWNFYSQYSESDYADTAVNMMKEIEKEAWDEAQRRDSRQGYEKFIKQFPQGVYSPEAYNNIVHSHLDTTSQQAMDNVLEEFCDYDNAGYSLIGIGNINNRNKTYIVTLTGEQGYRTILKPGESKFLEVVDGEYTILVESEDTESWWGNIYCYGEIYGGAWYIKTQLKHSPFEPLKKIPLFGDMDMTPMADIDQDENIDKKAEETFINMITQQCED